QQYRQRHPFTGAEPGAWAWTALPGGVPDGDDTPGALLALSRLLPTEGDPPGPVAKVVRRLVGRVRFDQIDSPRGVRGKVVPADEPAGLSVAWGLSWLLGLQNRDGGWPTFCRGWGRLPFDRSGCDLTAHALRALHAWKDAVGVGWFSRAFSRQF